MIAARLAWEEEAAPVRRQLRLRGREPNAAELEILERQPASDPALDIALRCWREVSTCRAIGMMVGPIPATAIDAWCDRKGLERDVAEFLKDALLIADAIAMEHAAKKRSTS